MRAGIAIGGPLLALGVAALVLTSAASAGDWSRYGGDAQQTNDVPAAEAAGIDATTVGSIVQRWTVALGSRVVASPLYAEGVLVDGVGENLVYVATESGLVVALSADDGSVVWQRQLGSVVVARCDFGNGPTQYGVSSTGVVDRSRNRLYVASADGYLSALDLGTGEEAPGWPISIDTLTQAEYVWGGLTLVGDRLYVPVASYCDEADPSGVIAEGRLVAIDVDDASPVASFDVVPGPSNLGGIWGYGGTSVDPDTGMLWTATGNAAVYDATCDCLLEAVGYAEAVVELSPDLAVLAWNRPSPIPLDPPGDTDFGATPLLFQPPGCPPLAAAHAKNGYLYVWRRDDIAAGPIWSAHLGPDDLANPFIAQPSYSPALNMLYVADARDYDEQGTVRSFDAVDGIAIGAGCSFPSAPTWVAASAGRGPKPPPLVVADVVFVNGGYAPVAFAFDARTGATLWTAPLSGAGFAPPAFAGDEVVIADASGAVRAYGLDRPPSRLASHGAVIDS